MDESVKGRKRPDRGGVDKIRTMSVLIEVCAYRPQGVVSNE